MTDTEAGGIHDISFIMKCDADICKDMFTEVVLSGGTTIFGVAFLTKQVLVWHALLRYWKETKTCKTDVYFLP